MISSTSILKSIHISIADKDIFHQQVLVHFAEVQNLVFINRNNQETNFIAVSNSSQIKQNSWQFGFVSYDYKNQIETQLHSSNIDKIQFAEKHFFSPELLFEITQHQVIVRFDADIYHEEQVHQIIDEIKQTELSAPINQNIKITPRLIKEEYLTKVKALQQHIQLGDIYEVNFCQEFYAEEVEINPLSLYLKLNEKSPTPFSCFVKHKDTYLLSASPERFIQKQAIQLFLNPSKERSKEERPNKKMSS